MLENSSFEGGTTHDTHSGVSYDNIFVPEKWVAYWNEDSPYGRIEMQVIKAEVPYLDPPRVYEGNQALKFFTMWRIHEAGVYQTVDTIPGTIYNVAAFAHAWSSQDDNPQTSEGAPGAFFALEGTAGLSDDQKNFTFAIGVDLTGGTAPWAATVTWGTGAHIYNAHAQIPTLGFVATGTRATVFLCSTTLWPFKHNDAYMDAATLTIAEEPPDPDPVDYVVTVELLPQDATLDEHILVVSRTLKDKRTHLQSADDAIRLVRDGLPGSKVDVWGGERWPGGVAGIDAYLRGGGVQLIEYFSFSDDPEPPADVIAYSQRDPEWSYLQLLPSTTTMGNNGCLVTAIAIYATLIDSEVTPGTLCLCLRENGGFNSSGGLIFAAVSGCLPYMAFRNYVLWEDVANMAVVAEALSRGPTILKVDWDVSDPDIDSHFVWAYDWTDETHTDISCVDPWMGEWTTILTAYPRGTIAQSIKGLVDFAIVDVEPEPVESPRPPGASDSTIALHEMQTGPTGIQNFLQTTHPPAHLVAGQGGGPQLALAHAWSPESLLLYRRVEDDLPIDNPGAAVGYVQRCIADLSPHFDLTDFSKQPKYLMSINERGYECGNAAGIQQGVAWDIALMDVVEATGLNLRCGVYKAAVGNPHVTSADLSLLLPMVARACAGKHLLVKHSYYASVPDDPEFFMDSGLWYQFRFAQDDAFFNAHGYFPYWAPAEGGACIATVGNDGSVSLNPGAGWKAYSIQRYRDELLRCHAWYDNWNKTHGNRFLSVHLFTTGGWNWDQFDLQGANLDVVTAGLAGVL